jgi:hypothetical protein
MYSEFDSIRTFSDVNPFEEAYTEDTNLFVVYVLDKQIVWKLIKDKDRKIFNAGNKQVIKAYFPLGVIDRPYTLVQAVEAQEVEIKLLEQYSSFNDFVAAYGACI